MVEKDSQMLQTRDIYNSEGIPRHKQRGSQRTCLYNGPRLFRLFSSSHKPNEKKKKKKGKEKKNEPRIARLYRLSLFCCTICIEQKYSSKSERKQKK